VDQQGVVDVDLEQVHHPEPVGGHRVDALVDDPAVGVLEGEDADVDLTGLHRPQHLLGVEQLHDLDLAEVVVAGVLQRRLFRK
jgi:hypothetical protein